MNLKYDLLWIWQHSYDSETYVKNWTTSITQNSLYDTKQIVLVVAKTHLTCLDRSQLLKQMMKHAPKELGKQKKNREPGIIVLLSAIYPG